MNGLKLGALAVAFLIGAVSGALGMATTALIVAGGSYLIGFISMGTAQALALWMGMMVVLLSPRLVS